MQRNKTSQPRGQGRPQSDGPVVGRERLLSAMRNLLNRKAPSKITRLDVAEEAGVDPALIRYYFGDRDTLLLEAAREIVQEIVADSRRALEFAEPAERLRNWVRNHALFHAHNPNLHQVLLELVVSSDKPRAAALRREFTAAAQNDLKAMLGEGLRNGDFRAVDTTFLEIAIVGMAEFFVSAWPIMQDSFGADADREMIANKYADFVSDLLIHALRATPPRVLEANAPKPAARTKRPVRSM